MKGRIWFTNGSLTAMLALAGGIAGTLGPCPQPALARPDGDPYAYLPATITLTGVVRDFKERGVTGGHTDFEAVPAGGYGLYMNNIRTTLDEEKKPVFVGGGRKVSSQWRTSSSVNIHPSQYSSALGDRAGAYTGGADPGGIASATSYAQWYRDIPGVNMSKSLAITLVRQANTKLYVFDDRTDPLYSTRAGFFPINNDLFGNSRNETKNFHFTYELATEFVYEPGTNQSFKFIGDDDVWVFINDRLVIDLGGVHSAVNQTVFLDRLSGLIPNGKNSLRVFQAERHRTQSNFRIETTITLRTAEMPNTSNLFD